jgi:transcriptional regulator with XRE-family HTH domain
MMNQPDLGRKIAELRKAKGLTQEELVGKCNLSVRTLQRIESGEVTPRSYTAKIIFAALDYSVSDSSEITHNKFSKTEFIAISWPGQFYRYVLDLFNLKTNKIMKISILSIAFSAIIIGLFAIITESKAQKEEKVKSQVVEKKSSNDNLSKEMAFTDFSCGGCMGDDDELIGRDIKFKNNGITVNVRLIRLNKKTREFEAFVKGKFLFHKVEVTCPQDYINDGLMKYSADKVEKSGDKILLKGNAKLTSAQNETIETDEIIITAI